MLINLVYQKATSMCFKKRLIIKAGLLTVIILACCLSALLAQSVVTRSAITFEIKNLGISTGGSISGLLADVHFTPANLNSSTLEASVDVNTINTDNSSRDEHLRSEDFFDVLHYPKIALKSIAFKHKGGNNYIGTFTLTIKGKSKQIEIPFTYLDKENAFEFKGAFKINRVDFGVGSKSMILADEVTVNIDCEEKKQESAQLSLP
jgi:polyisoprenoid-binding protein YceI